MPDRNNNNNNNNNDTYNNGSNSNNRNYRVTLHEGLPHGHNNNSSTRLIDCGPKVRKIEGSIYAYVRNGRGNRRGRNG